MWLNSEDYSAYGSNYDDNSDSYDDYGDSYNWIYYRIIKKLSEWDSSSEDERDMEAPCPQTLKINAVIFHHGYSSYRFSQDDIALVQLKPINSRGQCAAFTEQTQPACVPRGTKWKIKGT